MHLVLAHSVPVALPGPLGKKESKDELPGERGSTCIQAGSEVHQGVTIVFTP